MTPFKATSLACVLAFLAMVGFAASLQARTITNDTGGLAADRLFSIMDNWYEEIRVVGFCASACTFYMRMPNACTTKKARWLFHGPKGGTDEELKAWVGIMAGMYPEPIKTAFLTDYQFREVTILGSELIRVGAIKECD